jgi:hypothetical protein
VQNKRSSERRKRIREEECRPREQGQKGWWIDLTRREKSKQIDRNVKGKETARRKEGGADRKRHAPAQDVQ